MAEPFIAQITMFGGNFAPEGWASCNGQLLSIAQNTALFSILGTTFGGDGEVTFGLPGLRGRTPRHYGSGAGISPVALGQKGGSESHILTANNLPPHSHALPNNAVEAAGNQTDPAGHHFAETEDMGYSDGTPGAIVGPTSTGNNATSNSPVNHLDPYLGLNYIIALIGIFPSAN